MTANATAIAPASIANLAVGFDLLGMSFGAAHDRVSVERTDEPGVRLGVVSGLRKRLPKTIRNNTALRGANALLQAQGNPFGVVLHVEKGVPMSAGMGGSAASSVAAVMAVNALLKKPLPKKELFPFCLEGERASSDPPPRDNTAACLFGGLVMACPDDPNRVLPLDIPDGMEAVVVHPALQIKTGESRKKLEPMVPMAKTIEVAGRLGAFIRACDTSDMDLLCEVMRDVWIEPQRAPDIAGFQKIQSAALRAGAIACSISGSGPSLFAWTREHTGARVRNAMVYEFKSVGIAAEGWIAPLRCNGAELVTG